VFINGGGIPADEGTTNWMGTGVLLRGDLWEEETYRCRGS